MILCYITLNILSRFALLKNFASQKISESVIKIEEENLQHFAPLSSFRTIRDALNAFLTVIICSEKYSKDKFIFSSRDFTRGWFNAARLKNLCLNFSAEKRLNFHSHGFMNTRAYKADSVKDGEHGDEVNKLWLRYKIFKKFQSITANLSDSMMRIWKIKCFLPSGLLNTILYIRTVD